MKKMYQFKLFPPFGIMYMVISILILLIALFFIDNYMPQYCKWEVENEKINVDRNLKTNSFLKYNFYNLEYSKTDLSLGKKQKILVIGDSYVYGDGYSDINQLWWKQLQLELYERGYYDVEIHAIAKSGASTYDQMLWLTKTDIINQINPDIIIMGYVFNDPELEGKDGNVSLRIDTSTINYFDKNNLTKTFQNTFPNIAYKVNNTLQNRLKKEISNEKEGYLISDWYDIIANDKWSEIYYDIALKPLGEYLNTLEIPSFVVTTPNTIKAQHASRYNVLEKFKKADITTYNIFNQIIEKYEKNEEAYSNNLKINIVNGHPGTFYTTTYAEYIADILEKDYSSILGNKYDYQIEFPINVNDYFPYYLSPLLTYRGEDYVEYKFKYPEVESEMLYMPIEKPYIKLALEFPVSISKIEIIHPNIQNVKLYLNYINEDLGYDDQSMDYIEPKKDNKLLWEIDSSKKVTSININSQVNSNDYATIRIYK